MKDLNDADWVRCPGCGAYNQPGTPVCYLCRYEIGPGAERVRPSRGGGETLAPVGSRSSSELTLVMLAIIVGVVCLGVGRETPVYGIVLAVVAAPALVWTEVVARRERARGLAATAPGRVTTFLVTLAVVASVFISAVIAFVITCFPIGLAAFAQESQALLVVALIAGGFAAVAAAWLTYRKIRPRTTKKVA